jgi:hypothetical protein
LATHGFGQPSKKKRSRARGRLYAAEDGSAAIEPKQEAIAELAGASRATVNHMLRAEEKRATIQLPRR